VGTSGSTLERTLPEVPRARSLPAWTLGAIVVIASNIICTWPPRMSVRAPELPLYGTWTMSTPASALKSSPAIW